MYSVALSLLIVLVDIICLYGMIHDCDTGSIRQDNQIYVKIISWMVCVHGLMVIFHPFAFGLLVIGETSWPNLKTFC